SIELVIVGPEDPLVNGIHDFFLDNPDLRDIPVIGPQKAAAALEGSKEFAKAFMMRHGIPTAAYQSFTAETLTSGLSFLETLSPPSLLSADGLAAGKGVLILDDLEEAKRELRSMLLDSKFGQASATVVIEEFLDGIELRSEEHTSELQSRENLVCRLLLEKKKDIVGYPRFPAHIEFI